MKCEKKITILLLLVGIVLSAQAEKDTIHLNTVEIYKTPKFDDTESKSHYNWLEKKVYKVYPVFSGIYKDYIILNQELDSLQKSNQKKKLIKLKEKEFSDKYRKKIIDLTQSEGRLLSKFMHRYTKKTTYDIIKNLKGGLAASFLNLQTYSVSVDLREPYDPEERREDAYTEIILQKAFSEGILLDVAKENK